ncbi:hypothetical protein ABZ746_38435 [Streptomyces sp. NPDC020096]
MFGRLLGEPVSLLALGASALQLDLGLTALRLTAIQPFVDLSQRRLARSGSVQPAALGHQSGGAAVAKARTALAAQHNASPALTGWENKALAATTGYTILYKPVAHSQAELTGPRRHSPGQGVHSTEEPFEPAIRRQPLDDRFQGV